MTVGAGAGAAPDVVVIVACKLDVCKRHWGVARRDAVVCGALENGQMLRLLGDNGCCLDAGRAGPNLADSLAREIDAFMRPSAGVVPPAPEVLQALEFRHVRC